MTKTHYALATALVLMLGVLVSFSLFSHEIPAQASPLGTPIGRTATTTTRVSVTTSAQIMATSTNVLGDDNSHERVWASICNPNSNPVWLGLLGDNAVDLTAGKQTTVIAAAAGYNTCFEITDRNQYSGAITASSTNGSATVIYTAQYVK